MLYDVTTDRQESETTETCQFPNVIFDRHIVFNQLSIVLQLKFSYTREVLYKRSYNMIPNEIFAEDMMSAVLRYGVYIGAVFQIICVLACITLTDEQSESYPYEKAYTDSDECSSEQSSPGHRATTSRARRHDKKKRR